jgi:hypothetical protein
MKPALYLVAAIAAISYSIPCLGSPDAPTEVPASHWASAAVKAVISRDVMDAPGGKFDGARKVTRIELANTLARFAKALEKGAWQGSAASAANRKQPAAAAWESSSITRYELAALLDRVGRNVMQGLPKPAGKTFGESEAFPPASLDKVPKSSPAYDSLAYLVKNHMLWGNSILLNPTSASVTGKDVVAAITMTIAGLNDLLTDEPQNREDLGAPPSHQRGK